MEKESDFGEPITRQTSLSRLTAQLESNLQQSTANAIPVIRSWYKNHHKLCHVRTSLQNAETILTSVINAIESEFRTAGSFDIAIGRVQSKPFLDNLSHLLAMLPRDPNVKLKQQALIRVLASAVLICFYPGHILSLGDDGSAPIPDTSPEAERCAVAAKLLVNRLLCLLKKQIGSVHCPINVFKQRLLGYRFAFRHFIESLDAWKLVDAERMVRSMQNPYMFCYGAYLAALNSRQSSSHTDIDSVVDNAQKQLERMQVSMEQLVGKNRAAGLQRAWQGEVDIQMTPTTPPSASEGASGVASSPVTSETRAESVSQPTGTSRSPSRSSAGRDEAAVGIGARNEQLLSSLSGMVGLDNDRLVHEICVNPSFRLPDAAQDPFKLPIAWRMRRANGPVRYSCGGPKPESTVDSASVAPSIDIHAVEVSTDRAVDIASFKDMPDGSPRAGRVSTPAAGQSESTTTTGDTAKSEAEDGDNNGTAEAGPVSEQAAAAVANTQEMLKRSFLDILGDQMVASLCSSPVVALDSKLQEGDVVPVVFASNENCNAAMVHADPAHAQQRPLHKYDAMSAKIVKLYYDEEDLINAKQNNNDAPVSTVAGSLPIGGDVVYLADGGLERGVDFRSRLVLSSDPPSERPLINALKDVTVRLTDTVPNRPDVLESLKKSIDADGLLQQMLSRRGVATADDLLRGTLQPLITVLQSLQAVDKSELTEQWWATFRAACVPRTQSALNALDAFNSCVVNLPAFFEFMSACIDDLRRDIANFFVAQLSVALQSSGPGYLGQKLITRRAATLLASSGSPPAVSSGGVPREADVTPEQLFPNTYAMLTSVLAARNGQELGVVQDLNEHAAMSVVYRASDIGVTRDTNLAVAASAFVALLQVPYRLDTPEAQARLPEVLEWDGGRLAGLRDQIDILAILSSVTLTVKQLQIKYGLAVSRSSSMLGTSSLKSLDDWYDSLHHRLDALLHEPSISMTQIVNESTRYFKQLVGRSGGVEQAGSTPNRLPVDWESELTRALRHVVTEGNPILSLFFKRICRVVLSALIGGNYNSKLATYSLSSDAQTHSLTNIVSSSKVIFDFSVKAHGSVYTALLQRARANGVL